MKRRRSISIAVLLIGIAGISAWLMFHPRDPVYEGKPLTQWVDECSVQAKTNSQQYFFFPSRRQESVKKFGPSAVEPLIAMLESRQTLKKEIYSFLEKRKVQGKWAKDLVDRWEIEFIRPQTAAWFLGCLGTNAAPAIPALMQAAESTNAVLSKNAIDALGAIHQRQEVVAPLLVRLAGSSNQILSLNAISAMGGFTGQPQIVVPALARAITNPGTDIYTIIAASRVIQFGSNGVAAVPSLRQAASNPALSAGTRIWIADALQHIAPDSTADVTVPMYARLLRDTNNSYTVILRLHAMGPLAKEAVPALLEFVEQHNSSSLAAAYALKAIGPEAAAKIWPAELERSRTRGQGTVPAGPSDSVVITMETREQFVARVRDMEEQALPYLITLMQGTDKSYQSGMERQYAAFVLGGMGAAARSAEPLLAAATNESTSARAALMKIRNEPVAPLIEEFRTALEYTSTMRLTRLLADFGTNAEPAVPALTAILADKERSYLSGAAAAYALGEIHSRPELSVPALASMLAIPIAQTRMTSLEALGKFGPAAKPAVPQIIESLEDLDYYARLAATNALKRIDPEAARKAGIK